MHVIASGSKGNATCIEESSSGNLTLIDCGISKKSLFSGMESCGLDWHNLSTILVTHDHSDHTKGLGVLARGLHKANVDCTCYVDTRVLQASSYVQEVREVMPVLPFTIGENFSLSGISVYPFKTSHDAASSCGFRIDTPQDSLGFITDTGIVTPESLEALGSVRILALESNHDLDMLSQAAYPYSVKQRIASNQGHLNNLQSAELLTQVLSDSLKEVVPMHISQEANTYRLPAESLRSVLTREGHSAQVVSSYQQRCTSVG